jgi:hypothetical protein
VTVIVKPGVYGLAKFNNKNIKLNDTISRQDLDRKRVDERDLAFKRCRVHGVWMV